MIVFELKEIYGESNWWNVTGGMAPDEIGYALRFDGQEVERSDSLLPLIQLYLCADKKIPSDELSNSSDKIWFQIDEKDGKIMVYRKTPFQEIEIETTYLELHGSLEPFLSELFNTLDGLTYSNQKNRAFNFVDKYFEINFRDIYRDLVD